MGLIDVGASFHRVGGSPLAPALQGGGLSDPPDRHSKNSNTKMSVR